MVLTAAQRKVARSFCVLGRASDFGGDGFVGVVEAYSTRKRPNSRLRSICRNSVCSSIYWAFLDWKGITEARNGGDGGSGVKMIKGCEGTWFRRLANWFWAMASHFWGVASQFRRVAFDFRPEESWYWRKATQFW